MFTVLVGCFQLLLGRYSRQDSVCIGAPCGSVAGDGPTGNMLALLVDVSGNPTVCEYIGRVRSMVIGAFENVDVAFADVVSELGVSHDESRSPVFQVGFNMRNGRMEGELDTSMLDLSLICSLRGSEIYLSLAYDTALFERETATRLLSALVVLSESVPRSLGVHVDSLTMMTANEYNHVTQDFSGVHSDLPSALTVDSLFELKAANDPSRPAVRFEGSDLSYADLSSRSSALARELITRHGVIADQPVGLCTIRCPEMVLGILGILKAGGGYIPLDPDYPQSRLEHIFEESGATVAVTTRATRTQSLGSLPIVQVVVEDIESGAMPHEHIAVGQALDTLAYIIYTSGSTGRPKGVELSHRACLSMLYWHEENYGLGRDTRYLQCTTHIFDTSVTELLAPLVFGGTMVMAPAGALTDAAGLHNLLRAEQITMAQFVPSVASILLETDTVPACLHHLGLGAEVLPLPLARLFFKQREGNTRLWNIYGPTECAVDATAIEVTEAMVEAGGQLPIGWPITNRRVFVVDESMRSVGIGVPGELLIGGQCLARGYCGRLDLTKQAFVQWECPGKMGSKTMRVYKTGDLVRFRADGAIMFMGRIDFQVKIRGLRIELGEIESVAAAEGTTGVREAVAIVREDVPGLKRIVVYVTAIAAGAAVSSEAVIAACKQRLPQYMVPSAVVIVEEWPRTSSGKIDRKGLPAPVQMLRSPTDSQIVAASPNGATSVPSDPPRTPTEVQLAAIWAEVLGLPTVGRDDDFFEAGGDSLTAMALMARVRAEVELQVSARDLFEAQTVRILAERIAEYQTGHSDESGESDDDGELAGATALPARQVTQPGSEDAPATLIRPDAAVSNQESVLDGGKAMAVAPRFALQLGCVLVVQYVHLMALLPPLWLFNSVRWNYGSAAACTAAPLAVALVPFVACVLVAIIKWLAIGRLKTGCFSMWSPQFLKWWFLSRLLDPLDHWAIVLKPSPVYNWMMRLLGARIGTNSILNAGCSIRSPDLVMIDDGARLGIDSAVRCHCFRHGPDSTPYFVLGPVHIGPHAALGPRAVAQPFTKLGEGATLAPLSSTALGSRLAAHSSWVGSPAREVKASAESSSPVSRPDIGCGQPEDLLSSLAGIIVVSYLSFIFTVPVVLLYEVDGLPVAFIPLAMLPVTMAGSLLLILVAKWTIIGRVSLRGADFRDETMGRIAQLRYWIVDRLILGVVLFAACGPTGMTTYPLVLRLLGAKIGRRVLGEGLRVGADVDLVEVGDDVWFGHHSAAVCRSVIGPPTVNASAPRIVRFHPVRIGNGAMVAELCVIVDGAKVLDGSNVGSMTLVNKTFPVNSISIGSPPVMLGYKTRAPDGSNQTDAADQEGVTDSQMSTQIQVALTIVPFLPMLLLATVASSVLRLFSLWLGASDGDDSLDNNFVNSTAPGILEDDAQTSVATYVLYAAVTPLAFWVAFAILLGVLAVLMLVSNVSSGDHQLHSTHILVWQLVGEMQFMVYGLVESFVRGSPLMPLYLRVVGAKVGRNVFWDTHPPAETTALRIGDDVIVESESELYAHTVDHGRLTHGGIEIGRGAIISRSVQVQISTRIGEGACLDSLTVVMKGEQIPPGTVWAGNPATLVTSGTSHAAVLKAQKRWESERAADWLSSRHDKTTSIKIVDTLRQAGHKESDWVTVLDAMSGDGTLAQLISTEVRTGEPASIVGDEPAQSPGSGVGLRARARGDQNEESVRAWALAELESVLAPEGFAGVTAGVAKAFDDAEYAVSEWVETVLDMKKTGAPCASGS